MVEPGNSLPSDAQESDQQAVMTLIPVVYQELRRLAQYYMRRERTDHTLQATALVHEVYLQLSGPGERGWPDRAHFFAAAAQAMRNLLVDYARARGRIKRGGGRDLSLDDAVTLAVAPSPDLLLLDEALKNLAQIDPRQGRIVELRYFVGLNIAETADILGISERTVKREWQMAKAWLYAELRGSG